MRTSITADTTVPIMSTPIPSQEPNGICTTVIIYHYDNMSRVQIESIEHRIC
jgi:hypothetical protein